MYLLLESLLETANGVVIVSVSEALEWPDLVDVGAHYRRSWRSWSPIIERRTSWSHRTKWVKRRTGVIPPTHYDTFIVYSGTQNYIIQTVSLSGQDRTGWYDRKPEVSLKTTIRHTTAAHCCWRIFIFQTLFRKRIFKTISNWYFYADNTAQYKFNLERLVTKLCGAN